MLPASGASTSGGTLALLETAKRAGVGRTVLLSSRAVFGVPVPGLIDDTHPTGPTTHYGALKTATEALATVYENVAVLRPTGVYGIVQPVGRTKWLALAESVLEGRPVPEARAGTEVHGEDVADAVWRLLTAPANAVAGYVFNCSDIEVDTGALVAHMRNVLFGRTGPPACRSAANRQSVGLQAPARTRLASRRENAPTGGNRDALRDHSRARRRDTARCRRGAAPQRRSMIVCSLP